MNSIETEKLSAKYKEFKEWCFLRDKHQCKQCTSVDYIRLYHEDESLSKLYEPSNVVTLCRSCQIGKYSVPGGSSGRGPSRFLVITVRVMSEESGLSEETVRRHIRKKKVDPWCLDSIRMWLNDIKA